MQRLLCLLAGLTLLAVAAGCDGPTSVGRDLIEEGGKQVSTARLSAQSARSTDSANAIPLITGSAPTPPTPSNLQQLRRVLAGQVADPAFGTSSATGYVDFLIGATAFPDSVTIEGISVRLVPTYQYGDTTQTLTLALRNMPEAWDPAGATADTTLEAGTLVDEYEVNPADSLLTLPLPDQWIQDRRGALRDTTFEDDFNGFQIAPQSGNAVLGFSPTNSRLRIETSADTVLFGFDKTLTTLSRSVPPNLPQNRLAVQSGVGPQALFEFDFEQGKRTGANSEGDSLTLTGLVPNRAELALQADTTIPAPVGFVRPELEALSLYATFENGQESLLMPRAFRNEHGQFVLSDDLTRALQFQFQGDASFTQFRVAPGLTRPISQNNTTRPVSLSPLALYGPSASCPQSNNDACTPTIRLTLTDTE